LADALDSKSSDGNIVRVRLSPEAQMSANFVLVFETAPYQESRRKNGTEILLSAGVRKTTPGSLV
jgi:hypothetical protein